MIPACESQFLGTRQEEDEGYGIIIKEDGKSKNQHGAGLLTME